MACLYPLTIRNKKTHSPEQVSCGQCINCRVLSTSELELLAKLEQQSAYKSGLGCSFVTLTYDPSTVPLVKDPIDEKHLYTLKYKDVQDFYKRVRRSVEYKNLPFPFKHITAGEYGDQFGRPHYHSVIFGMHKELCEKIFRDNWRLGLIQVGTLLPGGIRYVIDYITNAPKGIDKIKMFGVYNQEPPFLKHSQKLGFDYLNYLKQKNLVNSDGTIKLGGKVTPLPRYYRRKIDLNKLFDPDNYNENTRLFYNIHFKNSLELFDDFKKHKSIIDAQSRIILTRQKQEPIENLDISYSPRGTKPFLDRIETIALEALENKL